MTTLTNSFEGGTNGTTLTQGSGGNTGGTSGSFFDVVSIGGGATDAFDNTHAAHGSLSCKVATVASAAVYNEWSTSLTGTSVGQVWFRLYLYFTANPTNAHRVFTATSTATMAANVQVLHAGTVSFLDSAGSAIFTTTTTIPLNAWFRIEGFVVGSAAAGQVSLSLYTNTDSLVPAETLTSAATQSTIGALTDVRFGVGAAVASVGPFWMDDIGVSTTGFLGPALAFAPGTPSSIVCGQAGVGPGTTATALFTTPPSYCAVTFYNLGATNAWIGTSTAMTSANGMLCSQVPTSYQTFLGSKAATFYGTTGSTVSTSIATIQYLVVTDF